VRSAKRQQTIRATRGNGSLEDRVATIERKYADLEREKAELEARIAALEQESRDPEVKNDDKPFGGNAGAIKQED
jgi:hypothetical protein